MSKKNKKHEDDHSAEAADRYIKEARSLSNRTGEAVYLPQWVMAHIRVAVRKIVGKREIRPFRE